MSGRRSTLVVVALVVMSALSFVPPSMGSGVADGPLVTGWIPMDGTSSEAPPQGVVNGRSPEKTPGIDATNLRSLHERGVTGEGVKVGVIGSEFSADHPAIDDRVSEYRQFASDGRLLADGAAHDTGVAEIVARTAPDSSLYLAGVGSRASPRTYDAAVEWLVANDVDVIVDSASYFPPDARSMEEMNAIATEASERGVVFVTSAGNYANRHWSGQLGAAEPTASATGEDTGEWLAFENDTRYNLLGDGEVEGRTSLRLYWTGDADLDLYVYRNEPGSDDPVVAKSTANQSGAGGHAESVDVSVPSGRYYVAVRAERVSDETTVDLFAANHDLSVTSSGGSMVAPATAERVITVGASDRASGTSRGYSSTGPMLDLSAPDGVTTQAAGDLYGSSASAPVVAGTAALMVSQNGALTPDQTEQILKRTANRSDGGLEMNATEAVAAASGAPSVRPTQDGRTGNTAGYEPTNETTTADLSDDDAHLLASRPASPADPVYALPGRGSS